MQETAFTREQVEKGVLERLEDNFRLKNINLEDRLSVDDFESLEQLNFVMELEDKYNIEITDEDAKKMLGSRKYFFPKEIADYLCGRLEIE